MSCSWLLIIVSLLLHSCPCTQVGWRNLIQLKNNQCKKMVETVYLPACFTACLKKKPAQDCRVRREEWNTGQKPAAGVVTACAGVATKKLFNSLCPQHPAHHLFDFDQCVSNQNSVSFLVFLSIKFLSVWRLRLCLSLMPVLLCAQWEMPAPTSTGQQRWLFFHLVTSHQLGCNC